MNSKVILPEDIEITKHEIPEGTELTISEIISQYILHIGSGETLKIVDKELIKYLGYFTQVISSKHLVFKKKVFVQYSN